MVGCNCTFEMAAGTDNMNYSKGVPLEWRAALFFQAHPQSLSRPVRLRGGEVGAAVAG